MLHVATESHMCILYELSKRIGDVFPLLRVNNVGSLEADMLGHQPVMSCFYHSLTSTDPRTSGVERTGLVVQRALSTFRLLGRFYSLPCQQCC
ncbi:hypothetical protein AMTR_s00001p00156050 [Amborella trichopoda]|uniref:Uncharacterized protein n=1 Tax=Amborella trichopoda TaxID=13333 RepID=W1NM12_AMBTC|nr:hypothetical protein AMTR_s00001p00156050 [Amborella trichopoda]